MLFLVCNKIWWRNKKTVRMMDNGLLNDDDWKTSKEGNPNILSCKSCVWRSFSFARNTCLQVCCEYSICSFISMPHDIPHDILFCSFDKTFVYQKFINNNTMICNYMPLSHNNWPSKSCFIIILDTLPPAHDSVAWIPLIPPRDLLLLLFGLTLVLYVNSSTVG